MTCCTSSSHQLHLFITPAVPLHHISCTSSSHQLYLFITSAVPLHHISCTSSPHQLYLFITPAAPLHHISFTSSSHQLHLFITSASPLHHTSCTSSSHQLHLFIMHCGYLFFLSVALWAELAAGAPLTTVSSDPYEESIAEELQAALQKFSSALNDTCALGAVPAWICSETHVQPDQRSEAADKLLQQQKCAEQLISFCPEVRVPLCEAITLNNDLRQHLTGSYLGPAPCPSPSTLIEYNQIQTSISCAQCWRQQVEALRT
ncbi:hypothetical protein NQZ68_031995 [Dissostichus eleginoides]|nr:hypothetical protein NQZ68_031995 [Dissostichus eleginoides]